jgi:hypothetical protein
MRVHQELRLNSRTYSQSFGIGLLLHLYYNLKSKEVGVEEGTPCSSLEEILTVTKNLERPPDK